MCKNLKNRVEYDLSYSGMSSVLTKQRKILILDRLRIDGQIVAKDLSAQLGISEDTIRRDLRELARDGLLTRVHGGAMPLSSALGNLQVRQNINIDEKRQLAGQALSFISPGQIIVLDGGTTTGELARLIPSEMPLTVVTHSPYIACQLNDHARVDVILIGGKMFKHSGVTAGASTLRDISKIRADLYFMGVTGVHVQYGLTTGDLEESQIKAAFLESAADTIVMCSREKLNAVSPFKIADLKAISGLILPTEIGSRESDAGNFFDYLYCKKEDCS